jgi:hypothetical protein
MGAYGIYDQIYIYIYEYSIIKPTKRKKEGKERGKLRKSNRVNLIKVHYMQVCIYHNGTLLYN